jgi:hypothetical protein
MTGKTDMTTLELKVNLSDRLAREATAGSEPLSMDEIQAEVDEVRKTRRAKHFSA